MRISRENYIYCSQEVFKSIFSIIITLIFITLFSSYAHARTVWRIGENDASGSEFGLPGSSGSDPNINKEVASFSPPKDPNSYDWQSFPCKIWPEEAPIYKNPREIHIIYEYPKDFRCPVLRIKAKSAVKNFTQELVVLKGGIKISQDLWLPSIYPIPDNTPEIPLGNIRKGLHEANTLIIKNLSLTTDNHSILFDYLELDDQDQDGDGSLDSEEVEGDLDSDGIKNSLDPDTATINIQSKFFEKSKKITLDLKEKDESGPFFTWLDILDTNSPDIVKRPPDGIFFPYCLFTASIDVPLETDTLEISIYTPADQIIHDTVQFYFYEEDDWRRIPVKILSQNQLDLSIVFWGSHEIKESETGKGLSITGGLAYPERLNIDIDGRGLCFIRSLWD